MVSPNMWVKPFIYFFLTGCSSCGRLYGVQTGSPTKSLISCKTNHHSSQSNSLIFYIRLRYQKTLVERLKLAFLYLNVVAGVECEAVVNTSRKDNEIAWFHPDSDPTVILVPNIKVATSS